MSKTTWDNAPLVVGDLHGMYEIAERVLQVAEQDGRHVYFLGDYLDSYDRSVDDQLRCLNVVLAAVNEGKATALAGNHELSYIYPRMMCSVYSYPLKNKLEEWQMIGQMKETLLGHVWAEDFLLTHAGVSQSLLDNLNITLEAYLSEKDLPYHYHIGRFRGGRDPVGGHYWCDWRYEFSPVDGVNQIVGHTRGEPNVFRSVGNNWCIDCLPHKRNNFLVAIIKNGELRERWIRLED